LDELRAGYIDVRASFELGYASRAPRRSGGRFDAWPWSISPLPVALTAAVALVVTVAPARTAPAVAAPVAGVTAPPVTTTAPTSCRPGAVPTGFASADCPCQDRLTSACGWNQPRTAPPAPRKLDPRRIDIVVTGGYVARKSSFTVSARIYEDPPPGAPFVPARTARAGS
jgi:hypothetical protein